MIRRAAVATASRDALRAGGVGAVTPRGVCAPYPGRMRDHNAFIESFAREWDALRERCRLDLEAAHRARAMGLLEELRDRGSDATDGELCGASYMLGVLDALEYLDVGRALADLGAPGAAQDLN